MNSVPRLSSATVMVGVPSLRTLTVPPVMVASAGKAVPVLVTVKVAPSALVMFNTPALDVTVYLPLAVLTSVSLARAVAMSVAVDAAVRAPLLMTTSASP